MVITEGSILTHFKVLSKLGEGGMGKVYRARDIQLGRDVAIKVLPAELADDSDRLCRLQREAEAIAALNHPNIVTIHSAENHQGIHFLVLELIEGTSLDRLLVQGGIGLDRIFELAIPIADALSAAHSKGIIHQDLKPGNILVSYDGLPKIVDFGLATLSRRAVAEGSNGGTTTTTLTQERSFGGTVPYMAPEQVQGKRLDARSDIFSLGVVLYQMCTSERPFRGECFADLVASILRSEPLPVTRINPAVPRQLERIIARCLRKEPNRRFQTALDIRNELEELQLEMSSRDKHGAKAEMEIEGEKRSLAVLPLRNLSDDPENEYLSEGMTEELISSLARVEGLRVVSRTSAFALKDKALSVKEIGDRLGVGLVVEGSVRVIKERVRVAVQLAETGGGYQLWSEKYDRELVDVFLIQDEICRSIAATLTAKLLGRGALPLVRHYSKNLEAYKLYLNGRYYWHQETGEALQHALGYFEQALKEDPEYAPAHAGVADYYVMLGFWGLARPVDVWPKAQKAAIRALELDPALAEAHVSLGLVRLFFDWDSTEADQEFRKALELNPSSADTHYSRTLVLAQNGKMAEALAEIGRARGLDPLAPILISTKGWVHYYARQYHEAATACQQALELDSDFLEARIGLGMTYKETSEHDRALAELDKARILSNDSPLVLGVLGATLAAAGRADDARSMIHDLDTKPDAEYVAPVAYAMLYTGLNETDLALEYLRKACESRDGLVRYLKVFPVFDSLREEPEFRLLLRELNLTDATAEEGDSNER